MEALLSNRVSLNTLILQTTPVDGGPPSGCKGNSTSGLVQRHGGANADDDDDECFASGRAIGCKCGKCTRSQHRKHRWEVGRFKEKFKPRLGAFFCFVYTDMFVNICKNMYAAYTLVFLILYMMHVERAKIQKNVRMMREAVSDG